MFLYFCNWTMYSVFFSMVYELNIQTRKILCILYLSDTISSHKNIKKINEPSYEKPAFLNVRKKKRR